MNQVTIFKIRRVGFQNDLKRNKFQFMQISSLSQDHRQIWSENSICYSFLTFVTGLNLLITFIAMSSIDCPFSLVDFIKWRFSSSFDHAQNIFSNLCRSMNIIVVVVVMMIVTDGGRCDVHTDIWWWQMVVVVILLVTDPGVHQTFRHFNQKLNIHWHRFGKW